MSLGDYPFISQSLLLAVVYLFTCLFHVECVNVYYVYLFTCLFHVECVNIYYVYKMGFSLGQLRITESYCRHAL